MRALLATLCFVVSVNAAPDLVLRNGLIYDGTGRAPFKGDIAIANADDNGNGDDYDSPYAHALGRDGAA